MILNVRHTGIVVPHLNDAIVFYTELGFNVGPNGIVTKEECADYYQHYALEIKWQKMFRIDCGHPYVIELYEIQDPDEIGGFHHISLTVTNIKEAWEFFSKKGLLMSNKIIKKDSYNLFFARDPWSNMLELVEMERD